MVLLALLLAQTPAAPPPVTTTGTVTLGFIALTGNSETLTFSMASAFERKSPEWILAFKAAAAYGQGTPAGGPSSEVTALNAAVGARADRRFDEQVSLYLTLGIDADHLKSIEARPMGELGVSYIWFDVKEGDLQKTSFRTDLGIRGGREYRFQYYPTPLNIPDVDLVAPRLGIAYRYAFTKEIIFTEEASGLINVVGDTSGRWLWNSTSKLSSRLFSKVSLGVGFVVNHDTHPAPGKVRTDTATTIGLEVGI